jgi:anaerobic ribonucleoside-triphosphate reductase activating protein
MIRIYGEIAASEVDGPGLRAIVHFAGCSIRCPGCFNRALWPRTGPRVREVAPEQLARELLAISPDITISGGEPTDQREGLFALVRSLRTAGARSIMVYTGRERHELLPCPTWRGVEAHLDACIFGPYREEWPETERCCGSRNQTIFLYTGRISLADCMAREVQVTIDGDQATVLGFPERGFLR